MKEESGLGSRLEAVARRVAAGSGGDGRLRKVLAECVREEMPKVFEACRMVAGNGGIDLRPVRVAVNEWDLPEGKVGSLVFGKDGVNVLTVSPRAFEDGRYRWVVLHELIHSAMGEERARHPHDAVFQSAAALLGIPEKYRD